MQWDEIDHVISVNWITCLVTHAQCTHTCASILSHSHSHTFTPRSLYIAFTNCRWLWLISRTSGSLRECVRGWRNGGCTKYEWTFFQLRPAFWMFRVTFYCWFLALIVFSNSIRSSKIFVCVFIRHECVYNCICVSCGHIRIYSFD